MQLNHSPIIHINKMLTFEIFCVKVTSDPDKMHHIRKKNRRKMLKPKFNSSSSDDDDDIDIDTSTKWRPAVPSFSAESNKWKRNHSVETNATVESLHGNSSKQQKLSAEVIQKEEIYNQAEMEANKKMFGCANPGRCLSKDEIKRRKDIILQIVNERLKSKLSELMGEFGDRLDRIDRNDDGSSSMEDTDRFRNQSPDDDDFIPEAPPPPTFNTTSESEEDLDLSMTKEFELYEKEIKEKTSSGAQKASTASVSTFLTSSNPSLPATYTESLQVNAAHQSSTSYQQSWQQMPIQQWPTTVQTADAWIPPVGPPQVPFLPPMESEQMPFIKTTPLFPTFPNANLSAPGGWIDPSAAWTNPPSNTFESNYGSSVPQYSNPQPAPFTLSVPPPRLQHFPSQPALQTKWNSAKDQRPAGNFNRPNKSDNSVQDQVYKTRNIRAPVDSKSTFVNAILEVGEKLALSTGRNVTKSNETTTKSANWSKYESQNANKETGKRYYEQKVDKERIDKSSVNKNSDEFSKRTRIDDAASRGAHFDKDSHSQSNNQRHVGPLDTENEQQFGSKANKTQKSVDYRQSARDRPNSEPIEWTKLCDIVGRLLDLPPDILKDLPPNDHRVKERNEILVILSDDPSNFYAYIDKYGEDNVEEVVRAAQRVLFPTGRYNKRTALALAPFQNAIRVKHSEVPVPLAEEAIVTKSTVSIPTKQETPKEWKKLCQIVDKLLGIPTHVMERLPSSDSRMRERNDILMILSNEPEDFLLHDEKYGARNVDGTILAAKQIVHPDGVVDERVQNIMFRQREMLIKGVSPSQEAESLKRSNYKNSTIADEHRSRSTPKEWFQLCDIVDKVLDTPKEVRIKMSKRDPRWEQRDNLLLLLSNVPDKLRSKSDELGRDIVEWAIKSSKLVMFPNGPKDRRIFNKLSHQREMLLRNQQNDNTSEAKQTRDTDNEITKSTKTEKHLDQKTDITGDLQKVPKEQSPPKKLTEEERTTTEAHQQNGDNIDSKVENNSNELQKGTRIDSKLETANPAVDEDIDEKDVWLKLCAIVDKLLDLPPDAAEKLEPLDRRLIERNDILMVLSDDPKNFSKFEADYGSTNVAWAVKAAKKLIYSNGKPNEKLTDALWKERDAIMCSEEEKPKEDAKDTPSTECKEWICVRKIATKAFLLSCQSAKNEKKLTKDQMHQQIELLLQLSDDPDIVRFKPIRKKIGDGRVEAIIARCKHLLNKMRKLDQKALLNFENLRSKMVLYSESLNQSKNIKNYDVILTEVRKIVDQKLFNEIYGQSFNKWTNEQKLERNELAILLIKDPHLIESNVKYMEMVRKTGKTTATEIVEAVEKCILKCDYVKEVPVEVCPPIIAEIKDGKFISPFREKKLIQRIHRLIEQFLVEPKPEVFDVRSSSEGGTIYVVCANVMTFEFLKKSMNELDGLWINAKLSISKAPITNKVLDIDDLKEIKMTLKTVSALPFAVVMKQLKKANSKLMTGKWQLVPASFSDPKKMFVMVDLESLVELERSKRAVIVDSGTIYFDIKYFGKENF